MTLERTITRPREQETEATQLHSDPEGGASPLLLQAEGWGNTARESLQDCQHGADAEQELRKRRNRSGQ